MTREEAINHIQYGIIENNYPLQKDLGIEACNFAIDTMRKYQKIEQIIQEWRDSGFGRGQLYEVINGVLQDGNDD